MKEKKHTTILLLIIILTVAFYSCQINKNNTSSMNKEFEYLDVIIRNNSNDVYYFNKSDIEYPACFIDCIDDVRRIKSFYFSMLPDEYEVINDMTIHASSFSYELKPLDVITVRLPLKQDFDEYYRNNFDETDFTIIEILLGNAFEKQFYIYCSKETFDYSCWFSDYSKKLQQHGIKLQGIMIDERTVLFEID